MPTPEFFGKAVANLARAAKPSAKHGVDWRYSDNNGTKTLDFWNTGELGPIPSQAAIDAESDVAAAAASAQESQHTSDATTIKNQHGQGNSIPELRDRLDVLERYLGFTT